MNFGSKDCTQVTFAGSEKMKNNLGDITLQVQLNQTSQAVLNISFSNVKWKSKFVVSR